MASNILGVGQSALNAAQTGLVTTGHNIANVNTPGYSRQIVVQSAAPGQNIGVGYVGKGTEVTTIRRVYNEFLSNQVMSSQTSKSAVDSYYAQIRQIDNMLADPTSGVSAAMQDFFEGVQDLASNPSSSASRQAMLSSAESLAARFQSVGGRLDELRQGVNTQITTSINTINGYAQQLANLNDAIEKAQGTAGEAQPSNDLLDQRDQVLSDLSKEIKVSVVKQGNSYNVFIGNGQALTVGTQVFKLAPMVSAEDPTRLQVGYVSKGTVTEVSEASLAGGRLGGLLDFRTNSLDPAQNELGRVASGLAQSFNAQHMLGQDRNGDIGTAFFTIGAPLISGKSGNSAAKIAGTITDASQLTTGNYRLQRLADTAGPPVAQQYVVTPLSGGTPTTFTSLPLTIDGVTIALEPLSAPLAVGDEFLVQPTISGASGFGVAISDIAKIAAAAPIRTAAGTANTGTGKISAGSVDTPAPTNADLRQPVTITFTSATDFNVTGTGVGLPTTGTYNEGDDISFNGWTVQITGSPSSGDAFTVGPNTGGVGDNRNALLLGGLQTANTLGNGTMTYQNAYTYMVSQVGNKTRELEVSSKAEEKMLEAAVTAQQAESGVNLDEEAANLMRYQQAYQAAAKVMQTAGQLFDLLLTLGN